MDNDTLPIDGYNEDIRHNSSKQNIAVSAIASAVPSYELFDRNDFTSFSSPTVILLHDLNYDVERYLEFVNNGGTLVIFGQEQTSQDTFSKFMINNTSIADPGGSRINQTGAQIESYSSVHNEFAVSLNYGKGRVIWLDSDTLLGPLIIDKRDQSDSVRALRSLIAPNYNDSKPMVRSDQDFTNNPILPELFMVKQPFSAIPAIRFLGQMSVDGDTSINSSYIDLSRAGRIEVDKMEYQRQDGTPPQNLPRISGSLNHSVTNIRIAGAAEVNIKSDGFDYLPSISHSKYFGISIQNGFDMQINLTKGSSMEFVDGNKNETVMGPVEIHFLNVNSGDFQVERIPLILKSPKVNVSGNVTIGQLYANDPTDNSRILSTGDTFRSSGMFTTQFDHIDGNIRYDQNGTITYLGSLGIDGATNQDSELLRIPGDISSYAKKNGLDTRWIEVFHSQGNIRLTLVILTAAAAAYYVINERSKKDII